MSARERPDRDDGRTIAERGADHAAIDRLADELLPALVARLGTTGLGELEVREGAWRVRLRRPAGAERTVPRGGRAASGRGQGRPGETPTGRDLAAGSGQAAGSGDGPSSGNTSADGDLPSLTSLPDPGSTTRVGPLVATSPAVGIYRLRSGVGAGSKVRAGDPLGAVDLLGVPVEVASPADGVVAAMLAEDGDAVEYGQPIAALEALPASADRPDGR